MYRFFQNDADDRRKRNRDSLATGTPIQTHRNTHSKERAQSMAIGADDPFGWAPAVLSLEVG